MIKAGDYPAFVRAIEANPELVNAANEDHASTLLFAARNNQSPIIRDLLAYPNFSLSKKNLISMVVYTQQRFVISEVFIDNHSYDCNLRGDARNPTFFHLAVSHLHHIAPDIVLRILEEADPSQEILLAHTPNAISKSGEHALSLAISYFNDDAIVHRMLSDFYILPSNLNYVSQSGTTALTRAISENLWEIAIKFI